MATYTTEDLIRLVKNSQSIPDSGSAFSDSVVLEFLDQSLKGYILPAICSVLEDYLIVTRDFQMSNQQMYPSTAIPTDVDNVITIPNEATGLRFKDLYVVGQNGNFVNLPRLTSHQVGGLFNNTNSIYGAAGLNYNQQTFGGFFLQGNTIQIFPYGLARGAIVRIMYERHPNDLCLVTDAGKVTSVVGDVLTLDKIVPSFETGTHVCVISQEAPYGFVRDASIPTPVYASPFDLSDVALVSAAGPVITLPTGTGADVQVGDWVCLNNQSVYAQNIPVEMVPALVRKASEMCLESTGDREGQQVALQTYNQMMKTAMKIIAPRVTSAPVKVLPINSPFRASRSTSYGGW